MTKIFLNNILPFQFQEKRKLFHETSDCNVYTHEKLRH